MQIGNFWTIMQDTGNCTILLITRTLSANFMTGWNVRLVASHISRSGFISLCMFYISFMYSQYVGFKNFIVLDWKGPLFLAPWICHCALYELKTASVLYTLLSSLFCSFILINNGMANWHWHGCWFVDGDDLTGALHDFVASVVTTHHLHQPLLQ